MVGSTGGTGLPCHGTAQPESKCSEAPFCFCKFS